MGESRGRIALTLLLAVIVATTGFIAPVTANSHDTDDHQRGSAPAGNAHDDQGNYSEDNRANDQREVDRNDGDGNSSFVVVLRVDSHRASGVVSIACVGTPLRHECDKDGGLQTEQISVDYHGNNSADVRNRTGGGGDTFTVTIRNRSKTIGFDCEMTRETVTNGTACTVRRSES